MEPVSFHQPEASSTYESGSSVFQQPSCVSPQNRGKFVSKEVAGSTSAADVLVRINDIRFGLATLVGELKNIQDAIWWRTKTSKDLKKFTNTLADLERPITQKVEQLYGFIGIHKAIPSIHPTHAIADILIQAKGLEIELLLAQKTIKNVKSLCECKAFRTLYDYRRVVVCDLAALANSSATQQAKIVTLQKRWEACKDFVSQLTHTSEKRKVRAIKELKVEIFTLFLTATAHISLNDVSKLAAEKRELTKVVADLQVELSPPIHKLPPISDQPQLSDDELAELTFEHDANYGFWANAPRGTWVSYSFPGWGGYSQTGSLGVKMEVSVGQRISGLLKLLEIRLVKLCQGDLEPMVFKVIPKKETLQDEISYFNRCYYSLKSRFLRVRTELQEKPFDDLTQTLFTYANALEHALKATRSLLSLINTCNNEPAFGLLQVMKKSQEYYRGIALESVSQESHLEMALGLFSHAKQIQSYALEVHFRPVPGKTTKPLAAFFERTLDLLYEVHAKKDPDILALTLQDMQVADCILSQGSLDMLYTQHERNEHMLLPVVVTSFLVKRMQQFLFLPAKTHDVELELVLHCMRTDPVLKNLYQSTLLRKEAFRCILIDYEKCYAERRDTLQKAFDPALQIAKLAIRRNDVQEYAQAWQRLREFCKIHPESVHEPIGEYLLEKLRVNADQMGYPYLYASIQFPDIETWNFKDPISLERRIRIISEEIRPHSVEAASERAVFDALVFRVLTQSLYAQDCREEMICQENIKLILEEMAYQYLRSGLSENVRQLLCENALKKITMCALSHDQSFALSPLELELVQNGPFEQFYNGSLSMEQTRRIEHVLFKLIKSEKNTPQKPITDTFKERMDMNSLRFSIWYEACEKVTLTSI